MQHVQLSLVVLNLHAFTMISVFVIGAEPFAVVGFDSMSAIDLASTEQIHQKDS